MAWQKRCMFVLCVSFAAALPCRRYKTPEKCTFYQYWRICVSNASWQSMCHQTANFLEVMKWLRECQSTAFRQSVLLFLVWAANTQVYFYAGETKVPLLVYGESKMCVLLDNVVALFVESFSSPYVKSHLIQADVDFSLL
jgi:hypothetical protein